MLCPGRDAGDGAVSGLDLHRLQRQPGLQAKRILLPACTARQRPAGGVQHDLDVLDLAVVQVAPDSAGMRRVQVEAATLRLISALLAMAPTPLMPGRSTAVVFAGSSAAGSR